MQRPTAFGLALIPMVMGIASFVAATAGHESPAPAGAEIEPISASVAITEPTVVGPSRSPVSVGDASDAERRLVEWAVARFEAAGLQLPGMEVRFFDTRDGCGGVPGVTRWGEDRVPTVLICTEREPSSLVSRRVLLHELAHAWAVGGLADADRDSFVAARRLPSWDDQGTPWELRGTEQAAEIVAWALLDEEVPVVHIPDAGVEALETAYRQLTGAVLPPRSAT